MKITLSTNQVAEELIQDFNANLSWEIAVAIAEHLKKTEEIEGVEIELDFKAICCHFLRFDSLAEWANDISLALGSGTEIEAKQVIDVKGYYKSCVKMYGQSPTEYQRGVLQGIECAMSLVNKST